MIDKKVDLSPVGTVEAAGSRSAPKSRCGRPWWQVFWACEKSTLGDNVFRGGHARNVRIGSISRFPDELERRERELAELEERLSPKERELRAYVAQLQAGLPIRPTLVEPSS
jgi:hypothetical protein